jgi:hypothetical protein
MSLACGAFLSVLRSVGEQRSAVSHSMCSVPRGAHLAAKLERSTRVRKIATTLVVALSLSLGCRTGEIVADSQALDDGRSRRVALPEVSFGIGGALVALRPAHVTMQQNPAMGGRCCVGNIGLDLLLQTGEVAIDFSTMTLRLQ